MAQSNSKLGSFCWVDLATTNAKNAQRFYSGLFGWECKDLPIPNSGIAY